MPGTLSTRASQGLQRLLERQPFHALQEELDELLGRFSAEWDGRPLVGSHVPSMDVSETDSGIEVRLDAPGVKPEDIEIELTGNRLRISGERKETHEEQGRTWHRTERRVGKFTRSMTVPCAVKEKGIKAEYHDGVLIVQMPKAEEAKSHKITVKPV